MRDASRIVTGACPCQPNREIRVSPLSPVFLRELPLQRYRTARRRRPAIACPARRVRAAKAAIGIIAIDRATKRHCWYVRGREQAFTGSAAKIRPRRQTGFAEAAKRPAAFDRRRSRRTALATNAPTLPQTRLEPATWHRAMAMQRRPPNLPATTPGRKRTSLACRRALARTIGPGFRGTRNRRRAPATSAAESWPLLYPQPLPAARSPQPPTCPPKAGSARSRCCSIVMRRTVAGSGHGRRDLSNSAARGRQIACSRDVDRDRDVSDRSAFRPTS